MRDVRRYALTAASAPPLGSDEVQLCRLRLPQWRAGVARLRELLTDEERARADRFMFVVDAERFTIGRGVLRAVLAKHLGQAPRHLRFRLGAHGKPYVDGVQFNVAHSGDLVVLAFHRSRAVGVDVECMDRRVDIRALAAGCFGARERAILTDERTARDGFFRLWVRKEAWLKATGLGLSFPLRHVDVAETGPPAVLVAPDTYAECGGECHLIDLTVGSGYAAACAIAGGVPDIRCWELGEKLW